MEPDLFYEYYRVDKMQLNSTPINLLFLTSTIILSSYFVACSHEVTSAKYC
jgi:hypothetical protein